MYVETIVFGFSGVRELTLLRTITIFDGLEFVKLEYSLKGLAIGLCLLTTKFD